MTTARNYALIMGIVFLLVGVLGFVDAATPNGRLLGLFAVNEPHNVIHIVTGLLGIVAYMVRTPGAGVAFAWFLLVAYGLVTLLGFVMTPDNGMLLNMIHINMADNWLHLLITLSALAVVMASQRRPVYR